MRAAPAAGKHRAGTLPFHELCFLCFVLESAEKLTGACQTRRDETSLTYLRRPRNTTMLQADMVGAALSWALTPTQMCNLVRLQKCARDLMGTKTGHYWWYRRAPQYCTQAGFAGHRFHGMVKLA